MRRNGYAYAEIAGIDWNGRKLEQICSITLELLECMGGNGRLGWNGFVHAQRWQARLDWAEWVYAQANREGSSECVPQVRGHQLSSKVGQILNRAQLKKDIITKRRQIIQRAIGHILTMKDNCCWNILYSEQKRDSVLRFLLRFCLPSNFYWS